MMTDDERSSVERREVEGSFEIRPQCDATDDVSADPCVLPMGHDGGHVPPTDECTCYLGNPELSDADEEACASCDAAFWADPVFRLSEDGPA